MLVPCRIQKIPITLRKSKRNQCQRDRSKKSLEDNPPRLTPYLRECILILDLLNLASQITRAARSKSPSRNGFDSQRQPLSSRNRSASVPATSPVTKITRRADLAAGAAEKRFGKDEYVCWQGETWPYVAYIASGRLEWTMLSPEGRRQVVFGLQPCDVIWSHSVVDGLAMPASLGPSRPGR